MAPHARSSLENRLPAGLHRSSNDAIATIQVKRVENGLAEHSRGIVAVPQWRTVNPNLTRLVGDALTGLASQFRLTVATVQLTTVEVAGGRLGLCVHPRKTDLPVALLLGPALLHNLTLDLDTARHNFHATTVGLTKTPALLVPFADDPDPPSRHQQFLSQIGQGTLQTILNDAFAWGSPTRMA